MKKKYIWFLVLGIFILIVPTAIYLGFLIPRLSEEYNVLMASGGVIGGSGMYGTTKIPEKTKYSGMYKLASTSFTLLTVITLVEKFIMQIVGVVALFIVCFIAYKIFLEAYRNGRRRYENAELAKEISRSIDKNS